MSSDVFRASKARTAALIVGLLLVIAAADWYLGPRASLGVFYIVPMVLGATVFPTLGIVALAFVCSILRAVFDIPYPPYIEQALRFVFSTAAYVSSSLLVRLLIRHREAEIAHLASLRHEQELRREAEEQLRILVDSSPAAILTVDAGGTVIAANRAAGALFSIPDSGSLRGRDISRYLPVLGEALRFDPGPEGLRTATQSQGRREDGEIFLANTWFSSYRSAEGMRLAAIIVDSSEEMRAREEQSFRQLSEGSRIAAGAVFHEVRNFCGAISLISSNLREKHRSPANDADLEALTNLAAGLEKIVAVELRSKAADPAGDIDLTGVLDDLRIVIEPDWLEIDGRVCWQIPRDLPRVIADRHGLLQVFLNLAHNSHRAVQRDDHPDDRGPELLIRTCVEDQKLVVRFIDTGPGVTSPSSLFAPFQPGANGTGLGLYISRAVVRTYGGDLRCEPSSSGACFAVELPIAGW